MDKTKKYLFICTYGQSRSRFFAERFMENGIKALFSGWHEEADIPLNLNLLEWADVIILLDKDFHHSKFNGMQETYNVNKQWIKFPIFDEPREFREAFNFLWNNLENGSNN